MQNKIEVDSELLNSGISLIFKSMVIMIAPVILGLFIYSRYIYTEKDRVLETEFNGKLVEKPMYEGRSGIRIKFITSNTSVHKKNTIFFKEIPDTNKYKVVTLYLENFAFNDTICDYAEPGDSIVAIKNEPIFKIIKKDTVLILNKYEYEDENRK